MNENELNEKMLMAYIGNNYDRITNNKFSICSFFLNWIYVAYRKFYPLLAILIGIIMIIIILPDSLFTIIALITNIILGLFFNKWYVSYAKKRINKIKQDNANVTESELIDICKKKGGIGYAPIFITLGIYFVMGIIFNFYNLKTGTTLSKIENSLSKNDWRIIFDNQYKDVTYSNGCYGGINFKLQLKNNELVIINIDNNQMYKLESIKDVKQLVEIKEIVSCDSAIFALTNDGKIYYAYNFGLNNVQEIENKFTLISSQYNFSKIGIAISKTETGLIPSYRLGAQRDDGTEMIYIPNEWYIVK